MSLLKNYITALQSEFIKKKGTGTYWLCFSFGILVPLVYFAVMLFGWDKSIQDKPVSIPVNYYQQTIGETLPSFLGFFFPLLIILIAAKITQIDHKNGGWQLMETQPLAKISIYLSKLTVLLIGNLIAIFSFFVSFVFAIWLVLLIKEVPENIITSIPFGFLGQLITRIFIASLFLSMVQFVISVIFKSFILPILIGFFAMLGTLILDGFQIYRVWSPFTILSRTASNPTGSQLNNFLLYTEKISIIGFFVIALIGFIWYQSKTFRRTFTQPKNLVKILGVFVLGTLGIGFLLSPNTYEKHNRTVLSGAIESNENIQKA